MAEQRVNNNFREDFRDTNQDNFPEVAASNNNSGRPERYHTPNGSTEDLNGNEPLPLEDPEAYDGNSALAHQLSRVMSQPGTIDRLESLSRVLSTRTRRDGKLEIDPEDFDLRVLLKTAVSKMDDQGVPLNKTGVSFKGLTSYGVDASVSYGPSVLELLRSLVSLPAALVQKPKLRKIIQDFDGYVEAGEMLLVLGRPGAGCSTFLKTIAGQTDQLKGVEGEILYDGASQKEMMHNFLQDIIYNPELDVHFPHLTVEQTLRFAIASRTPRVRLDNMSRGEYQDLLLKILLTVFGLNHTTQTKVGDDYVRGVSGGERKRVSIAEALAGRGSIYCWDNSTRGLDASTALEYNHAIRAATNFLDNSAIVAIYQAGENIYKLYDKVTVIYAGQQVYFGPAEEAKAYFEEMGYKCPPRQTTAEFLTSVTDPNGRYTQEGMQGKVPTTAEEFVAYWKKSPQYAKLVQEIDDYNSRSSGKQTVDRFQDIHEKTKMKHQRTKSRYLLTYRAQLALTVKRGFQRVWGDKAYTVTNVTGNIIQSLIMGSLFYNLQDSTTGAFSRGGVLFMALLFNALSSLAEISNSFNNRKIMLKQHGYSFYHPSAEALQAVLSDIPVKTITIICFSLILYFMTNMQVKAGQFFFFLFVLWLTAFCIAAFFQMISALNKTAAAANSIAGLVVLLMSVFTGYLISRPDQPRWFFWISFLDPVQYGFESLMANEFHGRHMPCDTLVPSGPGYEKYDLKNQACAFTGSQPGKPTVSGDVYISASYSYTFSHMWRNVGILFGFWLFFLIVNTVATEFLRPVSGGGDVLLFKRGHIPQDTGEGAVANENDMAQALGGADADAIKSKDIFSWQNVDYTIPIDGGTRKLLDNVQGYVKPGTMTALMGESGAGKTTLLNVLSQRINFGVITGDMLVNGRPVDSSFQRRTGYVQQQDLHLSTSTVRESLRFAARLRQPSSVPDSEKLDYVEKILRLLGMEAYAEAYVGEMGRGLNVEQRKKLSIGVELVAKPSLLLFLDEPTSGLDSQSAWAIVKFMRSLANAGQAILCTIHQPSATLFEEFDRLLLLKKGGQTVYFGDIGTNSRTMLDYFERYGRKCEDDENPAEYILEMIGAGATAHVAEDWHELWSKSPECETLTKEIEQLHQELAAKQVNMEGDQKELVSTYASNYFTQMRWVLHRTCLQFWRSPSYIMAKFALMLVGGLFLGFTFWNAKNTIKGQSNIMFATFMVLVLSPPLTNQIQDFCIESRELYEAREKQSNTFHWTTLLLSQYMAEMPYHFLFSTICFACFYFPVQFDFSAHIAGFFYFNYCVLFQLNYVSFGLLVAYFSPDAGSANVLTSVLFTFLLMFCGVMQPPSQMPGFWTFVWKVSPYTYLVQNLLGVALHDRPVVCAEEEYTLIQPPSGMKCGEYLKPYTDAVSGYVKNLSATSDCQYCQYKVGDEFLTSVDAKYSYRWRNVGFLCAYIVFNVVGMLVLYYLFRVKVWKAPAFMSKLKKSKKGQQEEEPQGDIYARQEGDEDVALHALPREEQADQEKARDY